MWLTKYDQPGIASLEANQLQKYPRYLMLYDTLLNDHITPIFDKQN